MYKIMKPQNKYMIINIDEPYAKIVYEVLKYGQMQKGEWPEGDISFEEWIEFSWSDDEIKRVFKTLSENINDMFKGLL